MIGFDFLSSKSKKWFIDVVLLSGFAIIAALAQFGRTYSYSPVVQLLGDSGEYASFAAALDYPEKFEGDSFLGNRDNFRFLPVLHIQLLQIIAPWAGGYGEAFLAMHGVTIFLYLGGFYLLGTVLTGNRFWGFSLALLVIVRIYVGWWMYWGYYADPLPRVTFNALLGFLLAGAVYWRKKHLIWPWIMLFAGATTYVDAPGALFIGFALWLGFWTHRPNGWSATKRTMYMLLNGAIFLVVATPFIFIYLFNHDFSSNQDSGLIYNALLFRIHKDYTINFYRALLVNFPLYIAKAIMPFIGLLAFVGLFYLKKIDRQLLHILSAWMVGCIFVSVGIPVFERALTRIFNISLIETELPRNIVYLVPLLLMSLVWICAEMSKSFSGYNKAFVALLFLILTSIWMMHNNVKQYFASPIKTLKVLTGVISCEQAFPDPEADLRGTVVAAKLLTPPRSRFLTISEDPSTMPQAIRYAALRPLVFNMRDIGEAITSNHKYLKEFYPKARQIDSLSVLPWTQGKIDKSILLAHEMGADYLIIDFGNTDKQSLKNAELVWSNKSYQILKIN